MVRDCSRITGAAITPVARLFITHFSYFVATLAVLKQGWGIYSQVSAVDSLRFNTQRTS